MKTIAEPKNKAFSVVLEIIFLLLIVSMVFSITGCDNTTKEDDDTPTPPISFTLSEYDKTDYSLVVGDKETITFYLSVFEAEQEDLEIVNSNAEVITCTFKSVHAVSGKKLAILNVTAKAEGEASIHLKDVNNNTKSEEIKFSVSPTEPSQETESKYANYTVYVNFSGSKFHFRKACAGETATATSYGQALKMNKTPCSKCAMYLDEETHFVGGTDDSQIGQRPTVGSNPELENCVENLCISYNENWSQNKFDGQLTATVNNTTVYIIHTIAGTSTGYYDFQSGAYDDEISTVIAEIKSYFENNIQDMLEITVDVTIETRFEVN